MPISSSSSFTLGDAITFAATSGTIATASTGQALAAFVGGYSNSITAAQLAINAGYAVGVGHTSGATYSSDQLNPAAFYDALRAGWSLAEATAVAAPNVGSTLRVIGDPLAVLPMPLQGYRVYDRATPSSSRSQVAFVPANSHAVTLSGLGSGTTHYYEVRGVSRCGIEDVEPLRLASAILSDTGAVHLVAPNVPIGLKLQQQPGGRVLCTWKYNDYREAAPLYAFRVYVATGPGTFDFSTPTATLIVGSAIAFRYTKLLGPYADGTLVRVIVRSASQAGGEDTNQSVAQIVADATAPDAPFLMEVV